MRRIAPDCIEAPATYFTLLVALKLLKRKLVFCSTPAAAVRMTERQRMLLLMGLDWIWISPGSVTSYGNGNSLSFFFLDRIVKNSSWGCYL